MAEVTRFYASTTSKVATVPKTKIKIRRLQPIPSVLVMDHRSSFTSFFERLADLTVNANDPKHENPSNTLRSLIVQEKELEGENAELTRKYKEAVEKSDVSYAAYLKAGRGFSQQAAKGFNEAWRLKEELRRDIVRHKAILVGVREDITLLRKGGD